MLHIYIGLDPAFSNTGYAIVQHNTESNEISILKMGVIRTKKQKELVNSVSEDNLNRSKVIFRKLDDIVASYVFETVNKQESKRLVDIAIYSEAMSYPRNASSAAKMALCWGVIASISVIEGIPVFQVSPQKIKKTLCGKNSASKEEIEDFLKKLFTTTKFDVLLSKVPEGQKEHSFDALAAIVAGANLLNIIKPS